MNGIEVAILRTILYGDVFQYPMTAEEIHRYLIYDSPTSPETIQDTLATSATLASVLHYDPPYYCLQENTQYIALRNEREQYSQSAWDKAIGYGRWLSWIPFVRMVALTGALSVRNPANANDDFDYILITKPGRVWFARGFAVMLVRVVRLFGYELCPNYVLASDKLYQARHDLFIAHEVTQMHPIFGKQLYHDMLQANAWTFRYLPNATAMTTTTSTPSWLKRGLEFIFGGWLGNCLEQWEYRRKFVKFNQQAQQSQADAQIDKGQVKGHFDDKGLSIMERYQQRLLYFGLDTDSYAMVGD